MFEKATKNQIKIRLAISGASGGGKTYSSLAIATHLAKPIALIDTERGSSQKYADKFDFDVCELTDFHPARYIEAITKSRCFELTDRTFLNHARWVGFQDSNSSDRLSECRL